MAVRSFCLLRMHEAPYTEGGPVGDFALRQAGLFIGFYGIWSDGSYERRRHSIGLVLIHDTHHDVNVEL